MTQEGVAPDGLMEGGTRARGAVVVEIAESLHTCCPGEFDCWDGENIIFHDDKWR